MPLLFAGDYLPHETLAPAALAPGARLVANLECVITGQRPTGAKAYSVVLPDEAFDTVAASGAAAFSLANNHVYDAGAEAFARMRARLDEIDSIQFFGTRQRPYAELRDGDLRCAVIGCLERCRSRGPALFAEEEVAGLIADLAGRFDRVFVTPHWGKEGEYAFHSSPAQRRRARQWLGAGAHAVLGHHSHTFQGCERVDSRPLYYSLGNLLFDHEEGRRHPMSQFGLAVVWTPGATSEHDRYQERFFQQKGGEIVSLDAAREAALVDHFEAVSKDLSKNAWTPFRWARAVGPVYIPKSRASWARRLARGSAKTVLLWIVWNLLPRTLLLRWGNRRPEKKLQKRLCDLDTLLSTRS